MRKGQISLFLIIGIGILIVSGVISWSFYRQNLSEIKKKDDLQILNKHAEAINDYIERCLFDVSTSGIYLMGLQGGFIDPGINEYYGDYDQVEWEKSGNMKIPYWHFDGMDLSPTIEQAETKLGRFILVQIVNCTRISDLPSLEGIEIAMPSTNYQATFFDFTREETNINVSINRNDVSVSLFFPIALSKNGNTVTIDSYYSEIPISIGEDFMIAKEILDKLKKNGIEGYNLEADCDDFSRMGLTNIFTFNNRILLIDYEPYLDPRYHRSFKFQYLFNDMDVYGYCSG